MPALDRWRTALLFAGVPRQFCLLLPQMSLERAFPALSLNTAFPYDRYLFHLAASCVVVLPFLPPPGCQPSSLTRRLYQKTCSDKPSSHAHDQREREEIWLNTIATHNAPFDMKTRHTWRTRCPYQTSKRPNVWNGACLQEICSLAFPPRGGGSSRG